MGGPLPKGLDRAQTVLFWRKGAGSPKIDALIEVLSDSKERTRARRP